MNTALVILAFLLVAAGIVGSVAPGLPGPPLAWAGLLLMALAGGAPTIGAGLLVGAALVCLVITLLDYLLPGRFTRRFGGSKAGVWGCNIGLVLSLIGLPFGPQGLLGIIVWPFVGALVGELFSQGELRPALRAATGAFVGFLSGTLLKVVYCVAALVLLVVALF